MSGEGEEGDGETVIIDNGSSRIKFGFATEEAPKFDIPAIVGEPKGHMQNVGGNS